MKKSFLASACVMAASVFTLLFTSASAYAERVLVVGDSITAQSNLDWGYTPMVRKALADVGATDVQFVPLGASGSTISSWLHTVERSKTDPNVRGDRPEILFKTEFDLGADTLFIFLGMNDALCPTVFPTEEGYAKWKADYCQLIDLLRDRVPTAKRILLCPATMLTENPYAFKNQMMDRMGEIMREIAKEKNAEIVDLRGEIKRFFLNVRLVNNAFHFTPDCVHPTMDGHRVMAWTFLRAMGQEAAAKKVYDEMPDWLTDFDSAGMSLFVLNSAEAGKMQIRGHLRGEKKENLTVTCPEGWKLDEIVNLAGDEFEIRLSGCAMDWTAEVTVKAGEIERKIKLNAPFYVSEFLDGKPFHGGDSYDAAATKTEVDDAILAGTDPLQAKLNGKPLAWTVYYPQADVTGYDLPNAVDFASVANGQQFQSAYIVRKVTSPKAQTVTLKINALSFSTMAFPTIYVNGKQVYEDCVSPRHKKRNDSIQIELKEGENIISARVGHFAWQWAVEFALEGENLKP
ncbi:MAG: GDSL-type esterase/lipase family protein [Planctomycetia bacterium]|nr:GDSL-type esterase/lipase family protein [Planctomycetia bacterium]